MELQKKIEEELRSHLKVEGVENLIRPTPNREMGDLALIVAYELAKKEKRPPVKIAEELVSKIRLGKDSIFAKVESKGGYINFFFNYPKLASLVLKEINDNEDYGSSELGKGKKFMLEFCDANTHKAFHIGHLRNICLGESVCRILEFSGHDVIRVSYQGDIGPHVAKCLWGFINLHGRKAPDQERGEWLGKVYAESNKRAEEDPEVEQQVKEINKKLYDGDEEIVGIWKATRQWCLDDFDRIYSELGVKFDRLYFESEAEKRGTELARDAVDNGVARLSDGAIIVDLSKYGLGIFVLISSDGTPLYPAKDFRLAEMKFEEYNPDRSLHVVGVEQKLYFQQLFKAFELIGSPAAGKSEHMVYELVNLKSGKMSSRMGSVVLYSDLKSRIIEKVAEEIEKRNPGLKDKYKVAKSVGLGALRYGMLTVSPEKLITFDWEQALKLEGNTGPYLQYAHTRCSGILQKAGEWKPSFENAVMEEKEKDLVKMLMEFPETVAQAARDKKPHYVCNYAYRLANAFDSFYEACPVLKAEGPIRDFRLTLVDSTRKTLAKALGLIGLEPLDKM
jgi:arginyl-tRNA synthetase